jgi:electron transport complex protein RnfC
MSKVIEFIGGYKKGENIQFIAGGPMMGTCMPSDDLIVTKSLNCVLVLKEKGIDNAITCLRCGRCSDVCPAKLAPVLIRDKVDDFEALKELHPEKCIECGLCSYICPSKIDVRGYVKRAKKEIRRH